MLEIALLAGILLLGATISGLGILYVLRQA
jgi:hypothetical protein